MITVQKVGPYTIVELDDMPEEAKPIEGLSFVFSDPVGALAPASEQRITIDNPQHTRHLVVNQWRGEKIEWLDGFLLAARELRS